MSLGERTLSWGQSLIAKKRPEPSYPVLPATAEDGQSSIPGIYLVGEVGGTPLIKLGLNQGVEIVNKLSASLEASNSGDADLLDFVIIGAGAAGLGATMRAHELGRSYVTLESERLAMTVENMYKGKILFAEPESIANRSSMWFEECTREDLLSKWRDQVNTEELQVHEHEKVVDIKERGGHFEVKTNKAEYRGRRILMCVGKAGNPRKAGVPGEQTFAQKVFHHLSDPEAIQNEKVFIYGGGDVAAEAALALSDHNTVTMVTIDKEWIFPKKRNVDALLKKQREGKLTIHMASRLEAIEENHVSFRDSKDQQQRIENDRVFEMIGAELPLPFFRKVGIALEGDWSVKRWIYLAAISLFVYSLYALKKYPEMPYAWPFNHFLNETSFYAGLQSVFNIFFLPFRWMFTTEAYQTMLDTPWFQQGYLYSLTYTLIMGWFGYQALVRWTNIARRPGYQKWRYISLILFQVVFFLIANVFAVQALSVQHSWRAWGLYQPWPLFFNTFNWWNESDPRVLMYGFIGAGLLGTFVAIPLLSRTHGKRFCTWVCGCGGLAETLGDRWRHLAPKGKRSRAWEFQSAVILVAVAIVTLITVGMFDTRANNGWALAYAYIVDFWLVAVIPIALYPFFGGKIWCRYWCPLAAWNQVLSKWYGRLRIKSNDQCISCTMCSRYCQVGVDVMAFAKNQQSFDNSNSSCIHCGICIDVCPMDVLAFETGEGPLLKIQKTSSG